MYDKGVQEKLTKEVLKNKGRRMEPTLLKIILISYRFKRLKKQEIEEQSIVPLNFLVFVLYMNSSFITAVALNEQVCVCHTLMVIQLYNSQSFWPI